MQSYSRYKDLSKDQVEQYLQLRENDPNYPSLVIEAESRGYVPAPYWVMMGNYPADVYKWKGYNWIVKGGDLDQYLLEVE